MLLGVIQENLLTLLSFDDERSRIIRNTIDVGMFGAQYKIIAARCYDYIDRYKRAPKAHLPDILDDKLNSDNKHEKELYRDIVGSMHDAREGINAEYVMGQLETFMRRQNLRSVAIDVTKALQRDTEESLGEAEELLRNVQQQNLKLFDPGTRLSDKDRALAFLEETQVAFPIGIPELDKRGFGPTRKEQFLFIANAKRGKSWFLIHLAKMAATHRLKVAHITLEMSEARSAQRYFQGFFAMSKRDETFKNTYFELDKLGRISGFEQSSVKPALSLDDPNIDSKLERRIKRAKRVLKNIYIKQFPTGHLTVPALRAYLDQLEQAERFTPDVIVIDYPDLMKIDPANARLSIDAIYKELRGIGVERNAAIVVVSQSHRASANAKTVRSDNVAEAYSKIAHADCIVTYSQTEAEHALGLARLHVAGGRNDQDKFTLVISQQYGMGHFVIDSVMMKGNYWENIPRNGPEDDDE